VTEDWVRTGTPLDDRSASRADTLWDGTKLYVASQRFQDDGGATGSGARSIGGAAVATDATGVTAAVRVEGSLPTAIMPTISVTAAADTRTAQRVTCRGGVGGSANGDFREKVGTDRAVETGFTSGAAGRGGRGGDVFSTTGGAGAGALSICSGGRGRF